jgi:hypothetical protein
MRMVRESHNTNLEKTILYRILEGKPEGKRPLGRPRSRSVDNIKIELRSAGQGNTD